MVSYTCKYCGKAFKQLSQHNAHINKKVQCKIPRERVDDLLKDKETLVAQDTPANTSTLKFIDLFCGIGGFHLAMKSLGAECVLACDIDTKCREVYKNNFGLEPKEDITKLKVEDIPDFDILCGGFPCQAFSHAGKQGGLDDVRGTLFLDVCRILRGKNPKYFLLENVKNLTGHDGGKSWTTIHKCLVESGYRTYDTPIVLSPHQIGVPQHRQRVFILGVRNDLVEELLAFPPVSPVPTSIKTILLDDAPSECSLSQTDIQVIGLWEEVVQHFISNGTLDKLPGFPIWSDDWDSTHSTEGQADFKKKFTKQNREFYTEHKKFLEPWLIKARKNKGFTGARRKLEWQCGLFSKGDSLWNLLLQFRPSGIRIKRDAYSPALVAMAQIVVVGEKRRKLSPREVARLQSFPDSFQLHPSSSVAYKQFGNSVNVDVIRHMAKHLLTGMS